MVCLGLEPSAAGWQAQMNPLSYVGTPRIYCQPIIQVGYSLFSLMLIMVPFVEDIDHLNLSLVRLAFAYLRELSLKSVKFNMFPVVSPQEKNKRSFVSLLLQPIRSLCQLDICFMFKLSRFQRSQFAYESVQYEIECFIPKYN